MAGIAWVALQRVWPGRDHAEAGFMGPFGPAGIALTGLGTIAILTPRRLRHRAYLQSQQCGGSAGPA